MIVVPNGPGLQESITEMIESLNVEHYREWLGSLDDEEEEGNDEH